METTAASRIMELARRMMAEAGSTSPRFRFDVGEADMFGLLKAEYGIEVSSRRRTLTLDEDTTRHLKMVAKWLTSETMKPSLLLYGGLGNGKTTMARCICEVLASMKGASHDYADLGKASYLKTLDRNNYGEFVRMSQMLPDYVRDAYRMSDGTPEPVMTSAGRIAEDAMAKSERYDKLRKSDFLIIDDLGCEPVEVKNYGTGITPVIDVIYHRYDVIAPTVITTNLDKTEIRERYGVRVADRLEEMCESIAFTNESYRRNNGQ